MKPKTTKAITPKRKRGASSRSLDRLVSPAPLTARAWGALCSNSRTGKYDKLAKWSGATIHCANPKVRVRIILETDYQRLLRALRG